MGKIKKFKMAKKKNRTKSKVSPPKPTTTTTASISDLPDLPLLTIFDYVPLVDLFHIDEVCRAWQGLKPAACSRRRHLIIANDPDGLQLLETPTEIIIVPVTVNSHNVLFIGHSRPLQTILERVLELMLNLKVFRLVQEHGSHEELSKVNQLLAHYRHQLVEVTILFWGELTNGDRSRAEAQLAFQKKFLSLMASLNRLTALRSLHVNFKPPLDCPVVLDDRQLATHCLSDVVGRLELLKFCTRLEFSNFNNNFSADARLLKQILFRMRNDKTLAGELSNLTVHQQPPQQKKQKDLELYVKGTPLTLKTLVSLGPVAAALRFCNIDGIFSTDSAAEYKALARFARQSPHLQMLYVQVKSLSIRRLVESLASLQELAYLYIFCRPAPSSPPEMVPIDQLPVLPSVKFLGLDFSANSHHDYEQLHLEVLFPNLKTVSWSPNGTRCQECGYNIPMGEIFPYQRDPIRFRLNAMSFKAAYGRQMQRCLRLARVAAFSRLFKLTNLFQRVCPLNEPLPFQAEQFTTRASLFYETEFLPEEQPNSYIVRR